MDVDSEDRLAIHKKILAKKPLLKHVFTSFHHTMMDLDLSIFEKTGGQRLELGAGVCPMKESYPEVLATDVVPSPFLDKTIDAENMDLPDNSIHAIYAQNCFHHLPHPDAFFNELNRVIIPGGGAILLEPYYGPFASFLFKRLFKTEDFDKRVESWESSAEGPMNGANQALSYIVFTRDKKKFTDKHPNLEIAHQEICDNYLGYLASGGLNFRQLIPNVAIPLLSLTSKILSPLNSVLGLHHITVLKKH